MVFKKETMEENSNKGKFALVVRKWIEKCDVSHRNMYNYVMGVVFVHGRPNKPADWDGIGTAADLAL